MQYDAHVQAYQLHRTLAKLHRTIKAAHRKPRKVKVTATQALRDMVLTLN